MSNSLQAFQSFLSVIKQLRAENGCPWDKEQTPLSLRSDLIEEVFEASEAISENDVIHAKEELGDVMLNAVMCAYMYEQHENFTVAEVFSDVAEKLIRRHPHVFPQSEGSSEMTGNVKTSNEVLSQWDKIKDNVEGRKTESILDSVPKGFPPLLKSYKLQKKASKKGFDWENENQVKEKVLEELKEVMDAFHDVNNRKEEIANKLNMDINAVKKPFTENADSKLNQLQLKLEEEIGDLLFSVVNLARFLSVDPSVALSRTNEKFIRRFKYVEKSMKEAEIPMIKENLNQMDLYWNKAKAKEKENDNNE